MNQTIFALSIQQPWAWLIVNGFKDVENRTWPTQFRGRFWVHAGKRIDLAAIKQIRDSAKGIQLPETFETGGIIGSAEIIDCVAEDNSEWFCGPWGFVIADPWPCEPRPCRGMLKFFKPEF